MYSHFIFIVYCTRVINYYFDIMWHAINQFCFLNCVEIFSQQLILQQFFHTTVNLLLHCKWLWVLNFCIFLYYCTSLLLVINSHTGLERPWGFQEVKTPRFQSYQHRNVVKLPALRTGRLYPQEILQVLIYVREWWPKCGRKDYVNEKYPVTPSGIELATLRLNTCKILSNIVRQVEKTHCACSITDF
jgi:hypothetical protein